LKGDDAVDWDDPAPPEESGGAAAASGPWAPQVPPRELLLGGLQQMPFRVVTQPLIEPHCHLPRLARQFCAASAIGSLRAPMAGEYTFSIQARSGIVMPVYTAMPRKSARSL